MPGAVLDHDLGGLSGQAGDVFDKLAFTRPSGQNDGLSEAALGVRAGGEAKVADYFT